MKLATVRYWVDIPKDVKIEQNQVFKTYVSQIKRWLEYRVLSYDENHGLIKCVLVGDDYNVFELYPHLKCRFEYITVDKENLIKNFKTLRK